MDDAKAALVLFAHGARDAAWAKPLMRLQAELQRMQPGLRVETAFLELQEPGLAQVADALAAEGIAILAVAPIFWSSGAHVERDLPALADAARARHPGLRVQVLPVLAELPGMIGFLAQALQALARDAQRARS
jgi:sirohydrochlorin cobaltochelatase